MNINSPGEVHERLLAARLREILSSIGWLRGKVVPPVKVGRSREPEYDLLGTVPLPGGGRGLMWVECRSEIRPSSFAGMRDRAIPSSPSGKAAVRVLAAPRISANVIEMCEASGWGWYDLAGNCCLDMPGLLHIERRGHEPLPEERRPGANLGTKEAARVVRALLHPENAKMGWTQRSLLMYCHPAVSLGLVNKVVQHLVEEGYMEPHPDWGLRLSDPVNLLRAWREAYRLEQHERSGYFTLMHGRKLMDALAEFSTWTQGRAAYAAFSAADFQAPNVRQPKTWLYVTEDLLERFAQTVEAEPVETGENMVVLVPSDEGVFYGAEPAPEGTRRMPATNIVQTFVDLWRCGARGQEAAEALLQQRLKPAWKEAGLKV